MKKIIMALFLGGLILSGCLLKTSGPDQNKNANQSADMANPAAVYCEEQGGILETVERDGGEDADCVFLDGVRCPQWDFFRGECAPDKGKTIMNTEGCTSVNGRVVEISNGIGCDDSEEKVANVVGFMSPHICCLSKKVKEDEAYQLAAVLASLVITDNKILLTKENVDWNTADGALVLNGFGLGYGDVIDKAAEMDQKFRAIENYLKDQGFATDPYNAGSGTPTRQSYRYKKGDIVCNLSRTDIEEKGSAEVELSCATMEEELCVKKGTETSLNLTRARQIAKNSVCGNRMGDSYFCNEETGTWWLDLNIEKEGCNPACVINIETKEAEINWRCTGLNPGYAD